ncbi:electron transport protein HydN|uniref:Electron transport protein HydN n=1 Tax=Brenneria salicis ATCC 15712 = DSM 30166 TaxID=714314 RepID=A0A366HZ64_9GAMM|nr:4Fe-4S binding protein [Brenneria salicis]NMN92056.1 electron transport protein HydN [Brenneria salicis ATCC 15712 = DSM 30166]RBP59514.1 electron transport protein HydN [Brenneria salicis ATCC 15712 = DSM 30166]RLM29421.1 effector protein [Brenneria salicis ATCC 15712 = DSM 30166]
MNRFVIADSNKCIGCRTCEVACMLAHSDGKTASLSPKTFSPRLTVIKGLNVSTTIQCRQCEDAPCANVCPNGAIIHADDCIQVRQEKCIGCKTCVVACPYGAMTVISKPVARISHYQVLGNCIKAEAQKCDLCAGRTAGPACIEVCPTKALHMISRDDIQAMIQRKQRRAALDEAAGMQF